MYDGHCTVHFVSNRSLKLLYFDEIFAQFFLSWLNSSVCLFFHHNEYDWTRREKYLCKFRLQVDQVVFTSPTTVAKLTEKSVDLSFFLSLTLIEISWGGTSELKVFNCANYTSQRFNDSLASKTTEKERKKSTTHNTLGLCEWSSSVVRGISLTFLIFSKMLPSQQPS